jgi:hypothetical protein
MDISEVVTVASTMGKMLSLVEKVREEILNDYTHLAPQITADINAVRADIETLVGQEPEVTATATVTPVTPPALEPMTNVHQPE